MFGGVAVIASERLCWVTGDSLGPLVRLLGHVERFAELGLVKLAPAEVAAIEQTRRAYRAHLVDGIGSSDVGSDAEVSVPGQDIVWTVTKLATTAGVEPRYVRQLCASGVLHSGSTKSSAGWLIEAQAAEAFLRSRRAR